MDNQERLYIEIPQEMVERGAFKKNTPVSAVYVDGNITFENVDTDRQDEKVLIRYFAFTAIISGLLSLINFWIQDTPHVPLTGANSIAQISIYLGLFFGCGGFLISLAKNRTCQKWTLRWRHIFTLTLAYGILYFAIVAIFFRIFSLAFIGLHLESYTSAILIGLIVGISSYILMIASRNIDFSTITGVLVATLFGGILFSMLTSGQPDWWQFNFSYLGTEHVKNAMYFNFTLIFSGLIMLTLVDYLFTSLNASMTHNRRLFALRVLFSLLAITLAGVGLFPNNPGWTNVVHDYIAQTLVLIILLMIAGIKWFLPKAGNEFIYMSYTIGVALVVVTILFQHFHFLTLTGFEIVACALAFFWLILLLSHLSSIALPASSFKTTIVSLDDHTA